MRKHSQLLIALCTSLAFIAAGCSAKTDTTSATSSTVVARATGTITVSAAASLTAAFTTIGDDFKKANPGFEVKFNFDSSSTLAKQIEDGAPADAYASADEANMKKLTDADLVGTPQVFARNELTVVVKKGNPKNVKSLADLAAAGTISLCGSEVPCGRYADQMLKNANVTIPADRITRGQNVKATLAAVAEGDADAGIVYVTDATGDKIEKVPVAAAQNVIAIYPIAVVKASKNQATAEAFMAFVLGPQGQATLKAAGFLPPT